jgi:hypothetical protein
LPADYKFVLPTRGEWIAAIAAQVIGFVIMGVMVLLVVRVSPLFLIPWTFVLFPLLRITGGLFAKITRTYDYRSEFAFTHPVREGELELHLGGGYDYPRLWRMAKGKRPAMRRLLLGSAIEALAHVARDIEAGTLAPETEVSAVSYFFSDATALRFGFKPEKVSDFEKLFFFLSAGDLVPLYWLLMGSFKMPTLLSLKRYTTDGANLVKRREELEKMADRLQVLE